MAEFKKGDKVRVIASVESLVGVSIRRDQAEKLPGRKATVAYKDSSTLPYGLEFANGDIWWMRADQLEAVKVAKPKVARPTKVKPKVAKPAKVKPVKVGLASLADAITLYPQTRKVLSHLERHGSISPLEAFGVYRITRLAARIKEIRNAGFKVETRMKTDPTGTKYAEYRLSHA